MRVTSQDPIDLLRVAISDPQIIARRVARETVLNAEFQKRDFSTDTQQAMHDLLADFLRQVNVQTRRRAAELLGVLGQDHSLVAIARKDPSWTVREAAYLAVTHALTFQTPQSTTVQQLIEAVLYEPYPLVQKAAFQGLKSLDEFRKNETLKSWLAAIQSDRFSNRKRGLRSMAELLPDSPSAHQQIVALLDDSHQKIRTLAARIIMTLAKNGQDFRFALPQLAKRMSELDKGIGHAAMLAFEMISNQQPESVDLSCLMPPPQFYQCANDLNITLETLTQILRSQVEILQSKPLFAQTICQREEWAKSNLPIYKQTIFNAVSNHSTAEIESPVHQKIAIKESSWRLGLCAKAILHATD